MSKYQYFVGILFILLLDATCGFTIRHGKHFIRRGSCCLESPCAKDSSSTSSLLLSVSSGEENILNESDEAMLSKFIALYSCNNDPVGNIQLLSFALENFKPLGCTVEESLVVEQGGSKTVFVSNVLEDGNARKAGIKVGDVIVAVSGNFRDDIVEVIGASLERVKGLITGRSEDDGLVIKVIRGSDVMMKHESALVDLCTVPVVDKDIEKCIELLYKADYEMKEDVSISSDNGDCGDDGDAECMLDQLFDMWGEDNGLDKTIENAPLKVDENKKKPAPWSSRSSPSGTFVRDPTTGKLVNIDE
jgi:hypothetical protein